MLSARNGYEACLIGFDCEREGLLFLGDVGGGVLVLSVRAGVCYSFILCLDLWLCVG